MADTGISIGVRTDWREALAELDDIGKRVLPNAIAGLLTKATFDVRDAMVTYMKSGAIDRPKPFTLKAFKVIPANWRDGDQMKARIEVQPKQSEYFQFLIFGGDRHAGDAGGGAAHDILTWSRRKSSQGGAYVKSNVQKIAHANRAERMERRGERGSRLSADRARAAQVRNGSAPMLGVDNRWYTRHPDPGTFFGTVQGITGYYQRPKRFTQQERLAAFGRKLAGFHRDVGAAQRALVRGAGIGHLRNSAQSNFAAFNTGHLPRLADMPWTKPGQQIKLLLAFRSAVPYTARFDYDGVMRRAFAARVNDTQLAASIRYHKTQIGARPENYQP